MGGKNAPNRHRPAAIFAPPVCGLPSGWSLLLSSDEAGQACVRNDPERSNRTTAYAACEVAAAAPRRRLLLRIFGASLDCGRGGDAIRRRRRARRLSAVDMAQTGLRRDGVPRRGGQRLVKSQLLDRYRKAVVCREIPALPSEAAVSLDDAARSIFDNVELVELARRVADVHVGYDEIARIAVSPTAVESVVRAILRTLGNAAAVSEARPAASRG